MELAQQSSALGPIVGVLAQTIATNNPPTGPSPTVARLLALRAELTTGRPELFDDDDRFDLLVRTLAHEIRLSVKDVLVRGLDEADRTVAVRVRCDAASGETMQAAAPPVLAAGARRLLVTKHNRYQATMVVDGTFNEGMALKQRLADPGQPPLLTGVVAANSSGTPLIWVSDVAAYALN